MTNLINSFAGLCIGILLITFIDVVGSVLSRRAHFKYIYLFPIAVLAYIFVGFYFANKVSLATCILVSCLVGIFDASAGWKLAIAFKANFKMSKEDMEKATLSSRIITMIIFSAACGYIGYFLGSHI